MFSRHTLLVFTKYYDFDVPLLTARPYALGGKMNLYEKCTILSKIGDERSLNELIALCENDNKSIQKTARTCLRKTRNKKV